MRRRRSSLNKTFHDYRAKSRRWLNSRLYWKSISAVLSFKDQVPNERRENTKFVRSTMKISNVPRNSPWNKVWNSSCWNSSSSNSEHKLNCWRNNRPCYSCAGKRLLRILVKRARSQTCRFQVPTSAVSTSNWMRQHWNRRFNRSDLWNPFRWPLMLWPIVTKGLPFSNMRHRKRHNWPSNRWTVSCWVAETSK